MKTVPKSTGNIGLDMLLQDLDLALTEHHVGRIDGPARRENAPGPRIELGAVGEIARVALDMS